jgi:cellulose synthase/poly-beta-1,6-N-acetylglucosamine synthase-like glycosyltransferase
MGTIVSCLLVIVASLLTTPVVIFFVEILATIGFPRQNRPDLSGNKPRPSVAVVIPAHNESSGILPTLKNIQSQLLPDDRLLVVADNCSDDTATIAKVAGAEVVERNDLSKRGKGYALDWGIRHLSSDPREIVLIVDADCRLADEAVENLITTCATTGRPTQALYLMTAPVSSQLNQQVAEFSWRVKNGLRPLGLKALDLPCQLMGTGMAFPWEVIRSADLASAQIVEDLKLGLDLTVTGHPPVFCPSARVTSEFASSVKGAGSQRQRWEKGHLDMILKTAPYLLVDSVRRRNWNLFAITLDLLVPPLSLLGILVLGTFCLSLLTASFSGAYGALAISTASLLIFLITTTLAWLKCGRDIVPVSALILIPLYAFRKINLYRQFIFGKTESEWTRTDRTKQ